MRYVVLFFGLVGAVGSGFIGYGWMDGYNHEKVDMAKVRPLANTGFFKTEALEKIAAFDRRAKAWPFLLTGAVLGLLGSLLAFERRRFSGSALLLCGALGPIVYNPPVAIFTFGLVLAGLLALFIRPRSAAVVPEKANQPGPELTSKSPPASSESVSEEPNSRGPTSEKSTLSRKGFDVLGLGVAVIVLAYLGAFGASYYGLIGYQPDEIPAPNPGPKGGKDNPLPMANDQAPRPLAPGPPWPGSEISRGELS